MQVWWKMAIFNNKNPEKRRYHAKILNLHFLLCEIQKLKLLLWKLEDLRNRKYWKYEVYRVWCWIWIWTWLIYWYFNYKMRIDTNYVENGTMHWRRRKNGKWRIMMVVYAMHLWCTLEHYKKFPWSKFRPRIDDWVIKVINQYSICNMENFFMSWCSSYTRVDKSQIFHESFNLLI